MVRKGKQIKIRATAKALGKKKFERKKLKCVRTCRGRYGCFICDGLAHKLRFWISVKKFGHGDWGDDDDDEFD